MTFAFRFFGFPVVSVEDKIVTGSLNNKEIALMAYMALEGEWFAREKLAGMFWENSTDEKAKESLRRAVANIKRVLPSLIQAEGRRILYMDETAVSFSDVSAFLTAYEAGDFKQAIQYNHADFLEGLSVKDSVAFDNWHAEQRAMFQKKAVTCLEVLLEKAVQLRNRDETIAYARQLINIWPWHEQANHHLIHALACQNKSNQAIATYFNYCATLKEELAFEPKLEMITLYEKVKVAQILPSTLPYFSTPFLGRADEIDEIRRLLQKPFCRLITLLGIGGVGKSRLACEIGQQLSETYLHQVHYVSLQNEQLPDENALIIELLNAFKRPLTNKALKTQLLHYLRPLETILIIDNFENNVVYGRLLSDILRECQHIQLLVTSRIRLDIPEEWVFDLSGLSYPDEKLTPSGNSALQGQTPTYQAPLFFQHCIERLGTTPLPEHLPQINTICQKVQGLPLALELIAPWTRTINLQEISAILTQKAETLLRQKRDFPQNQQSLTVVFQQTWKLLTTEEQQLFAKLSLFPTSFTQEAAIEITATSKKTIHALIKKSMLIKQADAYLNLHPLLRLFGESKRPDDAELEATYTCFFNYYFHLLHQALPSLYLGDQAVLQRIEIELENILKAWRWGIANQNSMTLLSFTQSLYKLFKIRNWFVLGIELFQHADNELKDKKADSLRSDLATYRGYFHQQLGEYEDAFGAVKYSLKIIRTNAHDAGYARALFVLGTIYYDNNRYNKAEKLIRSSLIQANQLEDRETAAHCLHRLGLIYGLKSSFNRKGKTKPYTPPKPFFYEHYLPTKKRKVNLMQGRAYLEEANFLFKQLNHRHGEALTLHCIGFTCFVLHEYEKSIAYFEKSIDLFKRLNAYNDLAQSYNWLAWLHFTATNGESAYDYFKKALEICLLHSANKIALDCFQKFSLFYWITEKNHFLPLAINTLVANHANTDARMRAEASQWMGNIQAFMQNEDAEKAINFGMRHTLTSLVHMALTTQNSFNDAHLIP